MPTASQATYRKGTNVFLEHISTPAPHPYSRVPRGRNYQA